jgi:hypothetical protein
MARSAARSGLRRHLAARSGSSADRRPGPLKPRPQLEGGKFGFTGIGAFETTSVVQTKNDFEPGLETGTYAIPGLAAAYQQANAAPIGSAAAQAAWDRLQKIEMQSAAAIVVATPNLIMFTARNIKGVGFSPAQPVPYPLDFQG